MKHRGKWSHLIYVAILPAYLCLFFLAERLVVDHYWASYLPLDDKIPFCEWFALPYVMWYPFLVIPGLIFLLKDGEAFRKYMLYIGLGFSSAVIFCLLFPNGQDLRPAAFPRENFCTEILRWIYSADTNTNVCPSMHVIGCCGAALAVHRQAALRSGHLRRHPMEPRLRLDHLPPAPREDIIVFTPDLHEGRAAFYAQFAR